MADTDKIQKFIREQMKLMTNGSGAKAEKAHKMLVEPEAMKDEMDAYTYIITKKPAKKKVEKYLQELINLIVAENED